MVPQVLEAFLDVPKQKQKGLGGTHGRLAADTLPPDGVYGGRTDPPTEGLVLTKGSVPKSQSRFLKFPPNPKKGSEVANRPQPAHRLVKQDDRHRLLLGREIANRIDKKKKKGNNLQRIRGQPPIEPRVDPIGHTRVLFEP